ncbi:MAG TPA: hypothetical protein VIN10_07350 [Bacteroidales bacterium]
MGFITYLLLFSRLAFFLIFQILIALFFNSWDKSEKYWLLSATLTNIVSITLLYFLLKKDGKNYLDIFRINKLTLKKDIKIFAGLALISFPIVFAPGYFLSMLLWENPNVPAELMFGNINKWLVYFLLIAFPLTIGLAELATYFMYIMPKLKNQLKVKWLAVALPVLFLSLQHCTLPFIPDVNFILYRALVFLPFSILIGVSIYYRPSLFVYFAALHGFMDFGAVLMYLM